MAESSITALFEKLRTFIPRTYATYVWAAVLSDRRLSERRKDGLLPWWLFLIIASALFVAGLTATTAIALHLDFLSLQSGSDPTSLADSVSQLGDSVQHVNSEITSHTPGRASAVFTGSIAACFVLTLLFACASARLSLGKRSRTCMRDLVIQMTFILSITLFKVAILWLAFLIVALGLQATGLMPDTRTHDSQIFMLLNIVAAAGTMLWIWFERKKVFKLRQAMSRPVISALLVALAIPGIAAQISLWVSDYYAPQLDIAIAPQCDKEKCFAFVQSKNIGNIVLDAPIRFSVKMVHLNETSHEPHYTYGTADITLAPTPAAPGVIDLGPDKEQIIAVRAARLTCKAGPDDDKAGNPAPIEGTGTAWIHLKQRDEGKDRGVIRASLKGYTILLFRHAEGGCKTF